MALWIDGVQHQEEWIKSMRDRPLASATAKKLGAGGRHT